jgi:hypothetical protein
MYTIVANDFSAPSPVSPAREREEKNRYNGMNAQQEMKIKIKRQNGTKYGEEKTLSFLFRINGIEIISIIYIENVNEKNEYTLLFNALASGRTRANIYSARTYKKNNRFNRHHDKVI